MKSVKVTFLFVLHVLHGEKVKIWILKLLFGVVSSCFLLFAEWI